MQAITSYELTPERICFESGGRMWIVPVTLRFDEHHTFEHEGAFYSLCMTADQAAVSRATQLGQAPEEQIVSDQDIGAFGPMSAQEVLEAAISFLGW